MRVNASMQYGRPVERPSAPTPDRIRWACTAPTPDGPCAEASVLHLCLRAATLGHRAEGLLDCGRRNLVCRLSLASCQWHAPPNHSGKVNAPTEQRTEIGCLLVKTLRRLQGSRAAARWSYWPLWMIRACSTSA